MTTQAFAKCHAVTAKWEGGWSNHKADPGGKTMYGITQAVYDAWRKAKGLKPKTVRYIGRSEAEEIYFEQYWQKARCEDLGSGVDLAVYDASVNSGVSRGRKWLVASVGGSDDRTVRRICAKRLSFMQALRIWKTFGRGWARRVADIEAKGVAWALAAIGAPAQQKTATPAPKPLRKDEIEAALRKVSQEAEATAKTQGKAAGTGAATGAAGGGGVVAAPEQAADLTWLLVAGGMGLTILVAFLIWRHHVNRARAEAYATEAARASLIGEEQ